MEKVYIVTSGCYSDYQINAVYSKEGDAEEYCRRGGEDYGVETYILDEPIPDSYISVRMDIKGRMIDTSSSVGGSPGLISFINGIRTAEYMRWMVRTDDIQRAVKVVNEKRTQILALNIWGDEEKIRELIK